MADGRCLVLKVAANEGTMYEVDDSLVFANDGIEHVVVSGLEYSLAGLADTIMSIHLALI